MLLIFYIVDCFAQAKYQGNPLAVFIPERIISDEEIQEIANEMGFSETSFILSKKQLNGGLHYRFFGSSEIAYQVSQGSEMGRPSMLWVKTSLIEGNHTIYVGGKVHLVAKGEWE